MTTAPAPVPTPAQAQIGFGQVRHARLRPAHNAFAYPSYFLMLPLRSMQQYGCGALPRNRFAPLSFYDADHGDGRGPAEGGALAWLDELLLREGIADASGEVWLHCYPRVWGHTFKPVSFWYCHRSDGRLRAIVAEVNNTFGQRHCYLLDAPAYGVELRADKVFHVSPFCPVQGHYRFRFMRTENALHHTPHVVARTVARIDYDDGAGVLLQTSVSGALEPITATSLRRATWRYPAMTWGVVLRIHWQALKLLCKRVPFFRLPALPAHATSRGTPPKHTAQPPITPTASQP